MKLKAELVVAGGQDQSKPGKASGKAKANDAKPNVVDSKLIDSLQASIAAQVCLRFYRSFNPLNPRMEDVGPPQTPTTVQGSVPSA